LNIAPIFAATFQTNEIALMVRVRQKLKGSV